MFPAGRVGTRRPRPRTEPQGSLRSHRLPRGRIASVVLAMLLTGLPGGVAATETEIDFDEQIRPLLSENCFPCHGPDDERREAGLRLDSPEGAFADLGGYAPFVPGDVEQSEAVRRVLSDDPDLRMPPPDSNLELSDSEKQTLRVWVDGGAEWQRHWAYTPPTAPAIPADESGWSRGEIDRFIAARARQQGLQPRSEADRETLIRRLTLDLTGLPPTPAEIDAFVNDARPHAYERLVDRLLASPHYGERMAWEWLNAARYADTDGFQGDPTRTMWPWRDWLIDALNRNMPFDQFTIEMLAGDQLDEPTIEQRLATGFNRNHMFNGEGGRIPEETRIENVFDRTETTATTWLGLTYTCCRCHDHKYDPISQDEYYQLFAFFNNTSETGRSGRGQTPPVMEFLPQEQRNERERWRRELDEVESQLAAPLPELDRRQREWEEELRTRLGDFEDSSELGDWWWLGTLEAQGREAFDRSYAPQGKVDLESKQEGKRWAKLDDVTDGEVQSLPETIGANYLYRRIESPGDRTLHVSLGSDDAIQVWLNGEQLLSKYITRAAEADQERVDLPLIEGTNELLIKIVNDNGASGYYFKVTGESLDGLSGELVRALHVAADQRSPDQQRLVREHYRQQHWPQWDELVTRRERAERRVEQLDRQAAATKVMVMDSLSDDQRRETHVLDRGDYQKPTDPVSPDVPDFLPQLPEDEPRDRLQLAKWIVSQDNPLTARVIVNRYWQTFFGRGLVATSEDFGSQGSRPSHPELLDWLALEFQRSGWDVKAMHKRIVMSATYRQTSSVDSQARELDPENKCLARAPRHRLPSWMLRDQALAASGLLVDKRGGPPVKPYQPEGVWAEATFGKIQYQPDSGEDLYRRSLYIFWRRIVGPTMFFDEAKRQTCEVKPTRTNTPLHALTTWNETTYVESARNMAQKCMRRYEQSEKRLPYAFRLTTGRMPNDEELSILQERLAVLRDDFSQHPEEAQALLDVGASSRDPSLEVVDHAAYTLICSLLLNLDETLSRE